MGKVTTTLTLTNWIDEVLAERGFISGDEGRSLTLTDVLVDTGATRLCLPEEVIEQLGLKKVGDVDVKTAIGPYTCAIYQGIKLNVEGREGRYDCIALPPGEEPLLGLIPLEDLGLEPDLEHQRLRVLPDRGRDTYMMAM